MSSNHEIHTEATKITHQAELGTPKALESVNKELHNDMTKYSASDYNKLLHGIQNQNEGDIKANSHLPKLEIRDDGKGGVPDQVSAKYSDGSVSTAQGAQQSGQGDNPTPPSQPTPVPTDGTAHGGGAAGSAPVGDGGGAGGAAGGDKSGGNQQHPH